MCAAHLMQVHQYHMLVHHPHVLNTHLHMPDMYTTHGMHVCVKHVDMCIQHVYWHVPIHIMQNIYTYVRITQHVTFTQHI
jgi:hypothetical protein